MAEPIGFIETFALAQDRGQTLAELIPGSEDFYFYSCLHAEQRQAPRAEIEQLLKGWVDRHGTTSRVVEMQNRLALLRFESGSRADAEHLRRQLGLDFDHQREAAPSEVSYPNQLDQEAINRFALAPQAFAEGQDLRGFTDQALPWLATQSLGPEQRHALLARLRQPDVAGLVEHVLADLDWRASGGFGSLAIHRLLTLDQLDQLAQRRPALQGDATFVDTRLLRLHPSSEIDLEADREARTTHLVRLWQETRGLGPSFNSLKVHVLYHLLDDERRSGIHDRERFLAYLALPRQVAYAERRYLERREHRDHLALLGQVFPATGFPAVGDDEPLVRELLAVFLEDADDARGFAPYLDEGWLRAAFASIKLLAGKGDRERWYSLLNDPSGLAALKERVDLDLCASNPEVLGGNAPVAIEVFVKNVPKLVIKVFELDVARYFLARGADIDTSIDLDGLVAADERTVTFDEPPLLRRRRRFDFPNLDRPGVFVVELIGGGRSSRALLKKGSLRFTERATPAGHLFQVYDEEGRLLDDASVSFGGHDYRADAKGRILVPFSTAPGEQAILLRHGAVATVASFFHLAESHGFTAGFYVERESLVAGNRATLLLRPQLTIAGVPAGSARLECPALSIEATDRHGTTTTRTVPNLELFTDGETAVPFTVPDELASIAFTLRARVRSGVEARLIDVSDSRSFEVNGIESTATLADLHLGRTDQGYLLSYLGKNGEPRSGVALNVILQVRLFTRRYEVTLATDDRGQVALGALAEVESLLARSPDGVEQTWTLHDGACVYPRQLHGPADQELRVPFFGSQLTGERVALFELRQGAPLRDCFDRLRLANGQLSLVGLEPGDYQLHLRQEQVTLDVRVSAGRSGERWLLGSRRFLETAPSLALSIAYVGKQGDELRIRLADAGPKSRVHVFATRFLPAHDVLEHLGRTQATARVVAQRSALSRYLSGRDLGDEMRYVLERRFARPYPGVLLERPSLLVQPWAVASTVTEVVDAKGGEAYAAACEAPCPAPMAASSKLCRVRRAAGGVGFSSLDFLARGAMVLANLVPDEEGVVSVPLAELAAAGSLRLVAVDELATVWRDVGMPQSPLATRDLRLCARALEPSAHFGERREITPLLPGERLAFEDATTARHQCVDTLGRAFAYLRALSGNSDLDQFEWLTRWPSLGEEERQEKLRELGCHEVSLFLARKDPAWFASFVRPLLVNKGERLFLDDYLCDADLGRYAETRAYARLNTLERILLAERLHGEHVGTVRRIAELCDLCPPDPEGDERRFAAGLGSGALDDEPAPEGSPPPEAGGSMMAFSAGADSELEGGMMAPPTQAAAPKMIARNRAARSIRPQPSQPADAGDMDLLALADEPRFLYQTAERTREWAETHYHGLRRAAITPELVPASPFWLDYARRDRGQAFVSKHLGRAIASKAECLLALAVLDLPFAGDTAEVAPVGTGLTLTARTPQMVFHRQIRRSEGPMAGSPVLVGQSYLRDDDRVTYDGAETIDKLQTELLVHTTYVCRVSLTNPSSSRQKLDVLLQIPTGALPAKNGFVTRGLHVRIEPFATQSIEYAFYFPAPGDFGHFPAHVAKNETLVAAAPPTRLPVLTAPSTVDTTSWAYLSQHGDEEEVLRHLDANNLGRIDLDRIAWRMRSKGFFGKTMELLTRRRVYSATLWSYGLYHRDVARLREYLAERPDFLRQAGLDLRAKVAVIDARTEGWLEHLEYAPLVNARAHRLGPRPTIANRRFAEQYRHFLSVLAYRMLDDGDRLALAYYLLLQDRYDEGIAFFRAVSRDRVPARFQHDYLGAWIALLEERPDEARRLAAPHADHPALRWRLRFRAMLAHLDELAGQRGDGAIVDPDSATERQGRLAASEPTLEVEVDTTSRRLVVTARNLDECQVAYYPMDVEMLFSRQPFALEQVEQLAYIRPRRHDSHAIAEGRAVVALPAELATANVVVEVSAAGLRVTRPCFAADLEVHVVESYGQVRVSEREQGRPLSRAYVKTYARFKDGTVRFYKDGYTDLAGRFDYATLSTDELDRVERFAILVIHETRGAIIREAAVPQR
jgi:hypothetical protein